MRKLRHWIRRYFGFSQREVNGFLWLISIMVLLTVAPLSIHMVYQPPVSDTAVTDKKTLDSLVAQLEIRQPEKRRYGKYTVAPVALYPFNPNTLTLEQWQAFGLPKYLAQRILNFRSKVGDFTYKAELGKIYGLPDSVFQRLHPFIQLPEERQRTYNRRQSIAGNPRYAPNATWIDNRPPREKFILAPFNINTADTTQLKQIRGIGSKLSARIIKYRSGLGGFHSMAQVNEVYSLPPEVVDSLHKYTFVAHAYTPPQLSINAATVEALRAHPYISSNLARAIVAYREQHGNFSKVEDMQQIKLVTPEVFAKLRPYLAL